MNGPFITICLVYKIHAVSKIDIDQVIQLAFQLPSIGIETKIQKMHKRQIRLWFLEDLFPEIEFCREWLSELECYINRFTALYTSWNFEKDKKVELFSNFGKKPVTDFFQRPTKISFKW